MPHRKVIHLDPRTSMPLTNATNIDPSPVADPITTSLAPPSSTAPRAHIKRKLSPHLPSDCNDTHQNDNCYDYVNDDSDYPVIHANLYQALNQTNADDSPLSAPHPHVSPVQTNLSCCNRTAPSIPRNNTLQQSSYPTSNQPHMFDPSQPTAFFQHPHARSLDSMNDNSVASTPAQRPMTDLSNHPDSHPSLQMSIASLNDPLSFSFLQSHSLESSPPKHGQNVQIIQNPSNLTFPTSHLPFSPAVAPACPLTSLSPSINRSATRQSICMGALSRPHQPPLNTDSPKPTDNHNHLPPRQLPRTPQLFYPQSPSASVSPSHFSNTNTSQAITTPYAYPQLQDQDNSYCPTPSDRTNVISPNLSIAPLNPHISTTQPDSHPAMQRSTSSSLVAGATNSSHANTYHPHSPSQNLTATFPSAQPTHTNQHLHISALPTTGPLLTRTQTQVTPQPPQHHIYPTLDTQQLIGGQSRLDGGSDAQSCDNGSIIDVNDANSLVDVPVSPQRTVPPTPHKHGSNIPNDPTKIQSRRHQHNIDHTNIVSLNDGTISHLDGNDVHIDFEPTPSLSYTTSTGGKKRQKIEVKDTLTLPPVVLLEAYARAQQKALASHSHGPQDDQQYVNLMMKNETRQDDNGSNMIADSHHQKILGFDTANSVTSITNMSTFEKYQEQKMIFTNFSNENPRKLSTFSDFAENIHKHHPLNTFNTTMSSSSSTTAANITTICLDLTLNTSPPTLQNTGSTNTTSPRPPTSKTPVLAPTKSPKMSDGRMLLHAGTVASIASTHLTPHPDSQPGRVSATSTLAIFPKGTSNGDDPIRISSQLRESDLDLSRQTINTVSPLNTIPSTTLTPQQISPHNSIAQNATTHNNLVPNNSSLDALTPLPLPTINSINSNQSISSNSPPPPYYASSSYSSAQYATLYDLPDAHHYPHEHPVAQENILTRSRISSSVSVANLAISHPSVPHDHFQAYDLSLDPLSIPHNSSGTSATSGVSTSAVAPFHSPKLSPNPGTMMTQAIPRDRNTSQPHSSYIRQSRRAMSSTHIDNNENIFLKQSLLPVHRLSREGIVYQEVIQLGKDNQPLCVTIPDFPTESILNHKSLMQQLLRASLRHAVPSQVCVATTPGSPLRFMYDAQSFDISSSTETPHHSHESHYRTLPRNIHSAMSNDESPHKTPHTAHPGDCGMRMQCDPGTVMEIERLEIRRNMFYPPQTSGEGSPLPLPHPSSSTSGNFATPTPPTISNNNSMGNGSCSFSSQLPPIPINTSISSFAPLNPSLPQSSSLSPSQLQQQHSPSTKTHDASVLIVVMSLQEPACHVWSRPEGDFTKQELIRLASMHGAKPMTQNDEDFSWLSSFLTDSCDKLDTGAASIPAPLLTRYLSLLCPNVDMSPKSSEKGHDMLDTHSIISDPQQSSIFSPFVPPHVVKSTFDCIDDSHDTTDPSPASVETPVIDHDEERLQGSSMMAVNPLRIGRPISVVFFFTLQ